MPSLGQVKRKLLFVSKVAQDLLNPDRRILFLVFSARILIGLKFDEPRAYRFNDVSLLWARI
jgi:hypothetical protein